LFVAIVVIGGGVCIGAWAMATQIGSLLGL
jgi:hypothetical protein